MELSPANSQDSPVENQSLPTYDEQLGLTFTQSFTSIAYNVTAVAQADSDGYGPAYLLNGLSNTGYWYQVGLSWNWPISSGFNMNYEVFDTHGNSIDPSSGGGGLQSFSGTVNQGDTVLLDLYFSGGNVVMYVYDYNTGASAEQTFSQKASSYFAGLASSSENNNGYFTGLMTEWWHSSAYYGGEGIVNYSENTLAVSSAWMWMSEWVPNTDQSLFSAATSSPVAYTNPNTLQYLSSNGATEASDAYLFVTGGNSATVSYSVQGGGSGYSPSSFVCTFGGVQYTIQLSTTPTTIYMDSGSSWSVSGMLSGSTSNEIWVTQQQTNGTAADGTTLSFVYFHQFRVSFLYAVANGGSGYSQPSVSVSEFGSHVSVVLGSSAFVDAGSSYSFQNPLPGSSGDERWATQSATGVVGSSTSFSATYYHQYRLTSSYVTVGGGGPAAPSLSLIQFGSTAAVSLSGSPTDYWSDVGQPWSVSNPLQGSSSTQRWYSQDATSGNASAAQTVLFTYYDQYYVLFGFNIANSGEAGYTAPTVNYTRFGSQMQGVANLTDWADASSSYSFASLLAGSGSSTRWAASTGTSGTVSGTSVVVPYYFQVAWTLAYSVSGGGSPTSPQFTSLQGGTAFSPTMTSMPTAYWFDNGSTWSVTNPLSSSTSSERWSTSQTGSGTISGPTTATFQYYHQFAISVGYVVMGGGNPGPPSWSGTAFGVSATFPIATTPSLDWLDNGQSWSVTNPLTGSGSTERWDTSQTTSGTVSATQTISFTYYREEALNYSYVVSGSGSGYSAPTLTTTQYGSAYAPAITTSATTYWADNSASWSLTNPLSGSGGNERWQTTQTVSGTVSGTITTIFTYYHQYTLTYSYSVIGGGSPRSPILTATQYGSSYTPTLAGSAIAYWCDAAQSWSVTNPLGGSGSSERWQSSQTVSGPVSAAATTAFAYYHQYYVQVLSNAEQGGLMSPQTDWYNSSEQIQLSATPNEGWQFEFWNASGVGSYAGTSNSYTITVQNPIVASAVFYPRLSVGSSSFGSVSYGSASLTGKVESATNKTLYVPLGSTVQLTASPELFLFKFDGWSGATPSSQTEIGIAVNSPESLQASFSIDWINTSILIAIILVAVGMILWKVVLQRRSVGKHDEVPIENPKNS